jgi:uncharacterized membrane protein YkoI
MAKRQVVVLAGIAAVIAALAGLLVPYLMDQASAQTTGNNQTAPSSPTNQTNVLPQIKGSISIRNATNDFIKNNVKVAFADAANTAKGQVTNGIVMEGRLSAVQGFLAYTFRVANLDSGMMKIVVVDAGNGKILYSSNDLPLFHGGFGGSGCSGHWNHHHFGSSFVHGFKGDMRGSSIPNNSGSAGSTSGTTLVMPAANF